MGAGLAPAFSAHPRRVRAPVPSSCRARHELRPGARPRHGPGRGQAAAGGTRRRRRRGAGGRGSGWVRAAAAWTLPRTRTCVPNSYGARYELGAALRVRWWSSAAAGPCLRSAPSSCLGPEFVPGAARTRRPRTNSTHGVARGATAGPRGAAPHRGRGRCGCHDGGRLDCVGRPRRAERVTGIEPAPSAWKAEALPLSYTRWSCPTRVHAAGGSFRARAAVRAARDVAQVGSASALGAEGRRFKSCHPDIGRAAARP